MGVIALANKNPAMPGTYKLKACGYFYMSEVAFACGLSSITTSIRGLIPAVRASAENGWHQKLENRF